MRLLQGSPDLDHQRVLGRLVRIREIQARVGMDREGAGGAPIAGSKANPVGAGHHLRTSGEAPDHSVVEYVRATDAEVPAGTVEAGRSRNRVSFHGTLEPRPLVSRAGRFCPVRVSLIGV